MQKRSSQGTRLLLGERLRVSIYGEGSDHVTYLPIFELLPYWKSLHRDMDSAYHSAIRLVSSG